MWDLPGPGLEPVSPALADGFLTTAPPGKSLSLTLFFFNYLFIWLHRVLVAAHKIFTCGMWDLLVVAGEIFSCGMWDL